MRLKNRTRAAVVAVAMMVAAVPVLAAGDYTVGDFVKRFAAFKQVDATDLETAVQSLGAIGIRVPADLDYTKRLTEADVARISRAAGLNVRTSNPESGFDGEQADRFFLSFGDELGDLPGGEGEYSTRNGETPGGESGDAPGNGPPFNPYAKGKGGAKGKKKGHNTPTEPD